MKGKAQIKLGFGWYFYNHLEDKYFISQKTPVHILKELLAQLKLDSFPLYIMGYSQGGYLAPFLGLECPQTQQVIGVSCVMKYQYLPTKLPFPIDQVHGEQDTIVSFENAKESHHKLLKNGNRGRFLSVPEHHKLQGVLLTQAWNCLMTDS